MYIFVKKVEQEVLMWVVSKNHEVEKLKSCRPANPTSRECVFCFLTETLQSFIVVWKLHAAGFTVWEISEAANRMSHSGLKFDALKISACIFVIQERCNRAGQHIFCLGLHKTYISRCSKMWRASKTQR